MAKMTVRRRAALVVAAGIVGALSGTGNAAARSAAASTAVYDCRYDAVSVSDAAGSVVPTARKTGVPLHAHLRVHNTEAVTLTKATYVYAIGNLTRNRGPAPIVQWRIGKGHWHKMGLHWNNRTNGSLPLWNSGTLSLGSIPARGTVTTEISVTFPKRSVKAVYDDFLDIHSGSCGKTRLDWYEGNGFEYWPW
ncbi:hypothetical protein GCM10022403_064800 [Streptomyces coacervatus]|uniref:Uncharacterized protein n=1 Tax=Streptomyces coacervatus TaxID=647381 RepID=A0ABP7IN31_9ACTN|nr:hypothetical protein [Streptomyces coacervatus]MDF2268720.1 hypothetical protein [Streptomyces coacervatus]